MLSWPHYYRLNQAWANFGPRAICGSLSFLIRPAELGRIILQSVSHKMAMGTIFTVFGLGIEPTTCQSQDRHSTIKPLSWFDTFHMAGFHL